MNSTLKAALAIGLACCACTGFAADLDDELQATWESLWAQTGYPTRLTRWELGPGVPLKVRFKGYDVEHQKPAAAEALKNVSAVAGLSYVELGDGGADGQTAQIEIEFQNRFSTSSEMPERFACVTLPKANGQTGALESVRILVKDNQAYSCMYHELMHAMGIPGHPYGRTVLSYFPWRRDQLMEFDQKLLQAWYSPAVQTGALPLFALDGLAEAMVHTHGKTFDEYRPLEQQKVAFMQKVETEMEHFAKGDGDIPPIVRRSGFASDAGIQAARTEMAFNLGNAYQRGLVVTHDLAVAMQWYEMAATRGHLYAHLMLASLYSDPYSAVKNPIKAYEWGVLLSKKVPQSTEIQAAVTELSSKLTPEQREAANARVASFSYHLAP